MNKEHKYKDKDEYKDNDKDKVILISSALETTTTTNSTARVAYRQWSRSYDICRLDFWLLYSKKIRF